MQQKYRLHWREIWKRALSGALSAAILLSGMIIPSVAADDGGASIGGGGDPDMLSYTVAEGLDFNDTGVFSSSEEAWEYADRIVAHVESTVEDMRKIFAKREVSITDEKYGAEPHEVFPIVEGTYKKSAEDAAAEAELAKKNTAAIYAAIKDVSESGGAQ